MCCSNAAWKREEVPDHKVSCHSGSRDGAGQLDARWMRQEPWPIGWVCAPFGDQVGQNARGADPWAPIRLRALDGRVALAPLWRVRQRRDRASVGRVVPRSAGFCDPSHGGGGVRIFCHSRSSYERSSSVGQVEAVRKEMRSQEGAGQRRMAQRASLGL